jgi:hypothetical protein
LSVCFNGFDRGICGDLGTHGQIGTPTYSRIVLSPTRTIDTKTFSFKFLQIGVIPLVFTLRKEETYPGEHHCNVGQIYDQIQLNVTVSVSFISNIDFNKLFQKRAETEWHYLRMIVNPTKPLNKYSRRQSQSTMTDDDQNEVMHDVIGKYRYRTTLSTEICKFNGHKIVTYSRIRRVQID